VVSIIIPAYNVQPYLESCLSQILQSGLSGDLYEVIIIDCGSSDRTKKIADKYSNEIRNVLYYKHDNIGLSFARNWGLSLARNKYIWFIDAEDLIKSEAVLDLIYRLVDKDLDGIAFPYYAIDLDGSKLNVVKTSLLGDSKDFLSGGEFYDLNFSQSHIGQYIFRKEIYISQNILFREGMIMDDSEILPRILAHVYRIGYSEGQVYINRGKEHFFKKVEKKCGDAIDVFHYQGRGKH